MTFDPFLDLPVCIHESFMEITAFYHFHLAIKSTQNIFMPDMIKLVS